jgi:hypothetical protein
MTDYTGTDVARQLADALSGDWGDERFEIAATLEPVVRRLLDLRAAEALEEVADWAARGSATRPGPLRFVAGKLRDRADALRGQTGREP